MSILNPFQLLELNVISAQDLAPVSRSMRTYAVAWVHPDRKLSTRVDTHGHANPTWNDKFVFRVDEEFLHADTSAVMIDIYALHWFKDVHVGTVRILVGNLIPGARTSTTSSSYSGNNNGGGKNHGKNNNNNLGMRFVALQVRRQSGRPQGILNIGVAILHSAMRSMPIYSQLSTSAVGYRELMGEEDIHHNSTPRTTPRSGNTGVAVAPAEKRLRRTKSDTSSMIGSEIRAKAFRERVKKVAAAAATSSSAVDSAETGKKKQKGGGKGRGRSKGSSLVSGVGGFGGVGKGQTVRRSGGGSVISIVESDVVVAAVISEVPRKSTGRGGYNKKGNNNNHNKVEKTSSVVDSGGSSEETAYVEESPEQPPPPARKKPVKSGKWGKVMSSLLNGYSEVGSTYEEEEEEEEAEEEQEEENRHKRATYFAPKKAKTKPVVIKPSSPRVKPSPRFNLADHGGGAPYKATPRRQTPGKSPYIKAAGKSPYIKAAGKSPYINHNKFTAPYEYGTPRKTPMVAGRGAVHMTESELGPSPSEVAAAIAKLPPPPEVDETESSVLGGWSVDESVEGLRSKLDRWRTELPPVYDRGELSSYQSSEPRHVRRHTDGGAGGSVGGGAVGGGGGSGNDGGSGGNGLFSCFSNICGVECSIVCGGGGAAGGSKRGGMSERILRSPSADNLNY